MDTACGKYDQTQTGFPWQDDVWTPFQLVQLLIDTFESFGGRVEGGQLVAGLASSLFTPNNSVLAPNLLIPPSEMKALQSRRMV